ncbi:Type III restriction-modification system EcoPI enzyme mod (M.EcoPI) (EcoPI methyltransferase) [Helicobacter cetorum MIT 00-7128]|uniref:site-specific DNA-methyltransferase (adenine-specific) n=1 Tax=Helicobacter cetorum (strain ATCC BAA-429 / MIT 00-7128) TaxID=182217 RepID=I0EN17_HELC0|nr:site-specific DNA-methyltransferase [Helicobacter cetorum]AFI04336.1 Type III restriction-modification system EcoPI enzyme mod (M.EcoPI) (EcoPI methyltransferase) [Helicobacter cetorum MIT 00-7128]
MEIKNNERLEALKQLLPEIFDKDNALNIEKLQSFCKDSEIAISDESYRLNFSAKFVASKLANVKPSTIICADNKHNIIDENKESQNILIKGDNLEVLRHLKRAYKEKIKMIYIDPPYNTNNKDFVYNDTRAWDLESLVKLGIEEKEANRVLEWSSKGANSHSAWLSFMYPRLFLARKLLKDDGVIFISIDDNEMAQLKLLCDEIFGEDNFVNLLSVVDNLKGNNNTDGIVNTHEYCLIYAKNKELLHLKDILIDEYEDELAKWNIDEYGYWKEGRNIKGTGENAPREKRPSMFYPIYLSDDLEISLEKSNKYNIEVLPLTNGKEVCWNWGKDFLQENKHELIVKKVGNNYNFIKKQRPSLGDLPSKKMKTTCYKPKYSTSVSSATMKQLFGEPIFNYSKSVYFICDLIQIATNEGDLILDFFAGSGTTAHAVLESNKNDYQKLSAGGGVI